MSSLQFHFSLGAQLQRTSLGQKWHGFTPENPITTPFSDPLNSMENYLVLST